jgi:hypothetical protein
MRARLGLAVVCAAHLLVGVALYATVVAATATDRADPNGYRAAFLTAAGLVVVFGVAAVSQASSGRRVVG